jgi:hypothetical protein
MIPIALALIVAICVDFLIIRQQRALRAEEEREGERRYAEMLARTDFAIMAGKDINPPDAAEKLAEEILAAWRANDRPGK